MLNSHPVGAIDLPKWYDTRSPLTIAGICNVSFEVFWRVEKRVITASAYGTLTEAELAAGSNKIEELILSGTAPLYLIIDASELVLTQSWFNLRILLNNMSIYRQSAKRVVMTLVITNNSLISFSGVMICRVLNVPMRVYKTMEEADMFLSRQIPDFETLKAPARTR